MYIYNHIYRPGYKAITQYLERNKHILIKLRYLEHCNPFNQFCLSLTMHYDDTVGQNASTAENIKELCGHQNSVVDCRIQKGEEEQRLLSASWDKTARMWDLNSGRQLVRMAII